jgi:hypothetical protein
VSELAARPPRDIPGLVAALRDDGYRHCAQSDSRDVGGLLVGRLLDEGPPVVEATVRAVEESGEVSPMPRGTGCIQRSTAAIPAGKSSAGMAEGQGAAPDSRPATASFTNPSSPTPGRSQ